MNDKNAFYDFLSKEENAWIKHYLLSIISQSSTLRENEDDDCFFHPPSEENKIINLNFVNKDSDKLPYFKQYFSSKAITGKMSLPKHPLSTESNNYYHNFCKSKAFSKVKNSEILELKLRSPFSQISNGELF